MSGGFGQSQSELSGPIRCPGYLGTPWIGAGLNASVFRSWGVSGGPGALGCLAGGCADECVEDGPGCGAASGVARQSPNDDAGTDPRGAALRGAAGGVVGGCCGRMGGEGLGRPRGYFLRLGAGGKERDAGVPACMDGDRCQEDIIRSWLTRGCCRGVHEVLRGAA